MRNAVILLGLCAVLAACSGFSQSRLNPKNWFGRSAPEQVTYVEANPVDPALADPRPLVAAVTELQIERAAGGAIVRASGLAPTQGYYGAELVPLAGETPVNGALVYFFRVSAPEPGTATSGPERTRTLTVARFVPNDLIGAARAVVVRASSNQRRAAR